MNFKTKSENFASVYDFGHMGIVGKKSESLDNIFESIRWMIEKLEKK